MKVRRYGVKEPRHPETYSAKNNSYLYRSMTRGALARCKACGDPHDSRNMPKHFPAGLTKYVLNNHSKQPPPYQAAQDKVLAPLQL